MAETLTAKQLIDLAGLVNLLVAVTVQNGVCSKIRAMDAESETVIKRFWSAWRDRLPGVTLKIEPHHRSTEMRVVVARRDPPVENRCHIGVRCHTYRKAEG